jgi:hypothetical protein
MSWFQELFQQNTNAENYRFLLECILLQINSVDSDIENLSYRKNKECIKYILENIHQTYKSKVFNIISYDILKNKVLNVEYGFGLNDNYNDTCLYYEINNAIQDELSDTYDSGCVYCGCSSEKDTHGDRICYCDRCSLNGCSYVD